MRKNRKAVHRPLLVKNPAGRQEHNGNLGHKGYDISVAPPRKITGANSIPVGHRLNSENKSPCRPQWVFLNGKCKDRCWHGLSSQVQSSQFTAAKRVSDWQEVLSKRQNGL
ncbi:hypothetical protein SUGI_0186400 [Cryptomeria japonica]|nr:hypothetical protein SUGI_0186400 [Cryptomeria japonica]